MVNLFETMMQAQNGRAAELMSRQFGLSQKQVELAVEALMPAFSTAFKRNTADPMGLSNWMQALASGQHGQYFDDLSRAFVPQGVNEGNGILGHLFGSKEVSRAVAAQAAQATGIGQEIFKQMLPVMASALMGGMFKQATNHFQAAQAAQGNIFGQVIEQMMKNGMGGMTGGASTRSTQTRSAPRNPNPMDNPLGQVLEQIFGNGEQVAPDDPEDNGRIPNPMNPANNPWGKMLEEMMGQKREPEPAPQPKSNNPYGDLLGDMFETGRKTQENYQRSMESIFDQYLRGMDRLTR